MGHNAPDVLWQLTFQVSTVRQLPSLEFIYCIIGSKNKVLYSKFLTPLKDRFFRNRFGFNTISGLDFEMFGLLMARMFSSRGLIFVVLLIFAMSPLQSAWGNFGTGFVTFEGCNLIL